MARGRPVSSQIRQNIVDILFYLGKAYGYDIYKIYCEIFPKCTNKSIYYHLKKGVELGEFEIESIKHEKGDYSWGQTAEKIYYKLGENASPKASKRVEKIVEKLKNARG